MVSYNYQLTHMINHVKDYWEQATKGKTATEQQGYNKRQKTVTFLIAGWGYF